MTAGPDLQPVPAPLADVSLAALEAFTRHGAFCCHHVLENLPTWLCADHPALGLMCWPCLEQHSARHALDGDRVQCTVCGGATDRLAPYEAVWELRPGLQIRTRRGLTATWKAGRVAVRSYLCLECLDAFGLRPADA